MADDEKKPERKKLSLQNSKLSLGVTQDSIRSSRISPQTGMRSVQIETRRKRVSRNTSNFNNQIQPSHGLSSQTNIAKGLTEHEKAARLKALKIGLQSSTNKSENLKIEKSEKQNEEPENLNVIESSKLINKEKKEQLNFNSEPAVLDKKDFSDRQKKLQGDNSDKDEGEQTSNRKGQKLKISVRREERRRGGKITVADALSGQEGRMRSLASMKRQREKAKIQAETKPVIKQFREVTIPDNLTVSDLANRMAEKTADVVKQLMKLDIMATATQVIDGETAELVVIELGHKPKRISESDIEESLISEKDSEKDLVLRPPVVTIMGHVDHGKTSLLDSIRRSDVAAGEAGGITQHIGAYQIETDNNSLITFIDTPGHAAFTEMRARGANITDIIVLVVSADDSVKEQTIEAINHAKAAKTPIIVAINKCDKTDADPSKVKTDLLSYELISEDMGGEVQMVEVSALNGSGMKDLLEAISLQAEILELKSNPDRKAEGIVIEAKMEKGRGSVATILISRGTLKVGDILVVGSETGRVRALINDKGGQIKEAKPSFPVEVLGLNGTPLSGDNAIVVESDSRAREIAEYRKDKMKTNLDLARLANRGSVEQMISKINEKEVRELPVVVKTDVHGSLEAIKVALSKIGDDSAKVQVLYGGVGPISESDVSLCTASSAFLLGFNVRAIPQARDLAKRENIDIRYHSIIYELIDEVTVALTGILDLETKEEFIGYAEVKEVFNISKIGKIAGCLVTEGVIKRGCNVRLLRENIVHHEGPLKTLKRFKDEVSDVKQGLECGIALEKSNDIIVGDVFECYEVKETTRTLGSKSSNQ